MRRISLAWIAALAAATPVAVVAVLAVVAFGPAAAGPSDAPAAPLVVHEWGTFTSLQGSDGVGLEGLQREEERLPSFVYARTQVRDCPLRRYGYKGLEGPVTHVTQKMETPVLYFHTTAPRRVRVRVDFVKGLISQWYPVSDFVGPPERSPADGPLDLATVDRSFLQWDVDLLPRSGAAPPSEIPAVAADVPWSFAREVDAAYVRTVPRERPERMGPTEAEHYLFYRGLGTFTLPIAAKAGPGGKAIFVNDGDVALPFAFALEMGIEKGRFRALGPVGAHGVADASLAKEPLRPAADVVKDLSDEVARVLVAQGLFADEARAMVRTWARSWFSSEGTRILYVVPRPTTDAILPLSITPAPDSIVRVLVGRLEYLSLDAEAEAVARLKARRSPDAAVRADADRRLARFDRFLESVVRRARAVSTDPDVLASADEILKDLAGK